MPARYWIRLAEIAAAFLLAIAVYFSWRADRRDRSQLESELAATKQLLTAAVARQHDRDNQLAQTLATLAAEKRRIVTPAQIVRELPSQIPLPSSVVLQSAPASADSPSLQTKAAVPAEDPQPLYDFTIDCKACQAKLAAAQGDLTTNTRKPPHSRANATTPCASLEAAASGAASAAAKWFLIGAAAGAVAAKTAH